MYQYIQTSVSLINPTALKQARTIVNNSFDSTKYFDYQLKIIDMAWICYSDYNVIGWATAVLKTDYAILKCVVVDPKYRLQGISSKLTELRLDYFKSLNYKLVKSYSWIDPEGSCASCRTLEKYGLLSTKDCLISCVGNISHDMLSTYCLDCGTNCKSIAKVFEKQL